MINIIKFYFTALLLFSTFSSVSAQQSAPSPPDFKATLAKANQGIAISQSQLGLMYEKGDGVKADPVQAAIWYTKAAEQGDAPAQLSICSMYFDGRGVQKNYTQSALWCSKAAEQGNALAQYLFGHLNLNGLGVTKNPNLAAKWFTKAAEQGIVPAQTMLGVMYGLGNGVPKDDVLAYVWFYLAAATGDSNAINNRTIMEKKLTAKQILEGKKLATQWQVGQSIQRQP